MYLPKNGTSASSVMKTISWVTSLALETGEMIGNVAIPLSFTVMSLTNPENNILVGCNGTTGWIFQ